MNVSLTPELEDLVNAKVASGMYQSASEVVREGLRLLREHDAMLDLRRDELRREVQRGLDSIARGNYVEYDRNSVISVADRVKAEGRRKSATPPAQSISGSGK